MIRRPPRSTRVRSSAASDVYKRQRPNLLRRRQADLDGVEFVDVDQGGLLFLVVDYGTGQLLVFGTADAGEVDGQRGRDIALVDFEGVLVTVIIIVIESVVVVVAWVRADQGRLGLSRTLFGATPSRQVDAQLLGRPQQVVLLV